LADRRAQELDPSLPEALAHRGAQELGPALSAGAVSHRCGAQFRARRSLNPIKRRRF
jgi:hypothetical protein